MLRKLLFVLLAAAIVCPAAAERHGGPSDASAPAETGAPSQGARKAKRAAELRVFQLNIWHDASAVAGAFDALVDQIVAGDFNEPSHLDWTDATRSMWDHGGCVVPWDCSVLLYAGGFRDAYRTVHPDPVTHPGFTYPSDNSKKEPRELTWAPDADERDHIDFVYYRPGGAFEPRRAAVVGPRASIVRCERAAERSRDRFVEPAGDGTWPTDHKGVLVTFRPTRK